MSNHWELYSEKPGCDLASTAIDRAYEEAIRLAPEKPPVQQAIIARDHVYRVMREYCEFGACDSDPDQILVNELNRHFNTYITRWSRCANLAQPASASARMQKR